MDHPAHLGEPATGDYDRCAYGRAHGNAGCQEPATIHFLVGEPHRTGVVAACTPHADEIRLSPRALAEHPFRRACATPTGWPVWNTGPTGTWCSP